MQAQGSNAGIFEGSRSECTIAPRGRTSQRVVDAAGLLWRWCTASSSRRSQGGGLYGKQQRTGESGVSEFDEKSDNEIDVVTHLKEGGGWSLKILLWRGVIYYAYYIRSRQSRFCRSTEDSLTGWTGRPITLHDNTKG